MSVTTIGTGAARVSQQTVYDPTRGEEVREVWVGTEAQLQSLATGYLASGIRTELSNRGGVPELTVYLQVTEGTGGAELPIDRWDIGKEYILKPVWDHPWVYSIAYSYLQNNTGRFASVFGLQRVDEMISLFRQMISNWLNGKAQTGGFGADEPYEDANLGAPLLPGTAGTYVGLATSSELIKLYSAIIRNGTDMEQERVTISRVRTFSVAYSSRMTLDPITKIYRTNSLISSFGVPSVIQAQLPSESGLESFTPEDTTWGWKVTADHSTINHIGKVEETKEWVFGNWPDVLYEVV